MKNKKVLSVVSIVFVLQIIVCGILGGYNLYVYNNCEKLSPEYKIKLQGAEIEPYYVYVHPLEDDYYWGDVMIYEGEDGFAVFKEKEKTDKGNNYFNYWREVDLIDRECVIFSEDKTQAELESIINTSRNRNKETYLTCCVYKGMFLPKALYIEGELVLRFDKEKLI